MLPSRYPSLLSDRRVHVPLIVTLKPSGPPTIPPTFPEDLEREIFEIAVEIDQRCAVVLVLVAKKVNIWITPILYRVLRFKHLRTCLYAESFLFKGDYVQEIHSFVGGNTLLDCIHRFPNLKTLVLDHEFPNDAAFQKAQKLRHVKELWFHMLPPLQPNFTTNSFQSLTHLGIFSPPLWLGKFRTSYFPNVTHVLIDKDEPQAVLSILDECRRLEVLLIPGRRYNGWKPLEFAQRGTTGMEAIRSRFGREDVRIVGYEWFTFKLEKNLGTIWEEGDRIVSARRLRSAGG